MVLSEFYVKKPLFGAAFLLFGMVFDGVCRKLQTMIPSIEEKRKMVSDLQKHYDNLRRKYNYYLRVREIGQNGMEIYYKSPFAEEGEYETYKSDFDDGREMLNYLNEDLKIVKKMLKMQRDELSVICQTKND